MEYEPRRNILQEGMGSLPNPEESNLSDNIDCQDQGLTVLLVSGDCGGNRKESTYAPLYKKTDQK